MKTQIPLKRFLAPVLAAVFLLTPVAPALAEIEDLGSGNFRISGKFYFNKDLEMLAPWGSGNNYGEFSGIVFKPETLNYPGIRELAQNTFVTFTVRARISPPKEDGRLPILVVLEIIDWEDKPDK